MSTQQVTLQDLLAQLAAMEERIAQLQAASAEVERRIAAVQAAEDALSELSGGEDALMPADPEGRVYVPVKVGDPSKPIVRLGFDIYARIRREKALELLREERASLSKVLEVYRRELAALAQRYAELRAFVEQIVRAAQEKQGQGGK